MDICLFIYRQVFRVFIKVYSDISEYSIYIDVFCNCWQPCESSFVIDIQRENSRRKLRHRFIGAKNLSEAHTRNVRLHLNGCKNPPGFTNGPLMKTRQWFGCQAFLQQIQTSLCVSTKTIRIKREKFGELLKNCEHYMWVAVGWKGGKGVSMGKNAGTEYVDPVFG